MEMVIMPWWAWVLFYVLVFIMLLIDLKSFGKKGQHEVSVAEDDSRLGSRLTGILRWHRVVLP